MTSLITNARRLYRRDNLTTILSRGAEKAERALGGVLSPVEDDPLEELSMRELRSWQYAERDLSAVLDTAYRYRGFGAYRSLEPMQIRSELRQTAEAVANTNPETVVEIGTARGGSYYVWARHFPATRFVSIDLPGGRFGGGYSKRRIPFLRAGCRNPAASSGTINVDREQTFIRGNSRDPRSKQTVERVLDEGRQELISLHRW